MYLQWKWVDEPVEYAKLRSQPNEYTYNLLLQFSEWDGRHALIYDTNKTVVQSKADYSQTG